ncbi:MAG: hypothetical protein HYZ34_12530 [Ignavibacteriae bacterium]|nr:hypothetical protein [Ignavibacteriota bacterium]
MWNNKRTMICIVPVLLSLFLSYETVAQVAPRVVHVFVALCDNENQGIIPVPKILGNGTDPDNNLYWGALYGVKTHFRQSQEWKLISTIQNPRENIMERCIFKHRTDDAYLVADAYKGSEIKQTVVDFLTSASGGNQETVRVDNGKIALAIGGNARLVAYIGHDGLMDFQLDTYPKRVDTVKRDAIILACMSKSYFTEPLQAAGATPLLWTTGLMAPEAYTLKSALDGWILHESDEEIRLRAAEAYHKYQKCGLRAAKNLLVTGW